VSEIDRFTIGGEEQAWFELDDQSDVVEVQISVLSMNRHALRWLAPLVDLIAAEERGPGRVVRPVASLLPAIV
jgi:hypothetical protein